MLEFALRGLSTAQRDVLHTIAAFRLPATWETLHALLVGEEQKPCRDDRALDATMTELEDRVLVGWDKAVNRYDLHPIVYSVVWQALSARARQDMYAALHRYFDAAPRPPSWENVECLEDLTSGIELFHTLIGLGRYENAIDVFGDHLEEAIFSRLSVYRQQAEMLERLFPDGVEMLPRLASARNQSYTLDALARAYKNSGEPGRAEPFYRRAVEIAERGKHGESAVRALCNLSDALRFSGHLRVAETSACRALGMCREQGDRLQQEESVSLYLVGLTLAACGVASLLAVTLCCSLNIWVAQKHKQGEGFVNAHRVQRSLGTGARRTP